MKLLCLFKFFQGLGNKGLLITSSSFSGLPHCHSQAPSLWKSAVIAQLALQRAGCGEEPAMPLHMATPFFLLVLNDKSSLRLSLLLLLLYFKKYLFIYLAVSGLSCGTRDLLLWRAGSVVMVHGLIFPVACGILVPQPGIEPATPALEGGF